LAQSIGRSQLFQVPNLVTTLRQRKKIGEAVDLWKSTHFALSVQEVSQQIGLNKRSLEYYFKQQIGYSPYQYLKRHRLNLARRALLVADPSEKSVTEIAMKFGFYELGRFSVYYRELFGDKPSETLKRFRGDSLFFA